MIGHLLSREAWVIARREMLERLRSKWFLIGTLLGPVATLAVVLVPALLAARENKPVKVAIVLRTVPASAPAPTPDSAPASASGSASESESGSASGSESESASGSASESNSASGSGSGSASASGSGSGSASESGSGSGSGSGSASGSASGSESGSASESASASASASPLDALTRELIISFKAIGWNAFMATADDEAALLAQIGDEKLNGFLVIPSDILDAGVVVYQGDNGTSALAMTRLQAVVTAAVHHRRGLAAGITVQQVTRMMAPVLINTKHTTGEVAGASAMGVFILGYVVMFLLYISILLYASNVMRSVVQEKTSRVVELMVAAVKPRALMAGKVLGVGAVGLLQLTVWLSMGVLSLKYRDALLELVGVASAGGMSMPPLTLAQLTVILLYFVLGYFLYAAMYAAVGAMVSSEQEAQQAQLPLMSLVIMAVACVQLVANDPRSGTAAVLTNFPFFSPMLMPMRYLAGGADGLSVLVSVAILVATIWLVVIAAGKIYRVGVLLHGKRPSLRELWRWLRY